MSNAHRLLDLRPAELLDLGSALASAQVEKLRGSLKIQYTVADVTARKLWKYMNDDAFVPALGAVTGNQAIQMVRGGLKSVYCSGWQVWGFLIAMWRVSTGRACPDNFSNTWLQGIKQCRTLLQVASSMSAAQAGG